MQNNQLVTKSHVEIEGDSNNLENGGCPTGQVLRMQQSEADTCPREHLHP